MRLQASRITLASLDALPLAVDELVHRAKSIYLHLDLDVLDPSISPGVNFSQPGGISAAQLFEAVQHVVATGKLAAVAIANFNPDRDHENRTRDIAQQLVYLINAD